jgi:cyclase
MQRRSFLKSTMAIAASSVVLRAFAQTQSTSAPTAPAKASPSPVFTPLRRHVGYFTASGGTIGWLASKDALAVVDTQFPDTAALCLAGLPERAGRSLDVVINTHHHRDHTGGNAVFKAAAKHIVAHQNVPELQRRAAERAQPPTVDQQVYADVTFPQTWSMHLGDEVVRANYFGAAHTKGDIVVYFERANVVHVGDLLFNRLYPVIDRPGGANIEHWTEVLAKIAREYPSDAQYIFGHGSPKFGVVGTRADLFVFRDFLLGLLEHVRKQIAAGKPKEEIVTLKELPGFPDFAPPGGNSRLPSNLGVAFDELTQASGGA